MKWSQQRQTAEIDKYALDRSNWRTGCRYRRYVPAEVIAKSLVGQGCWMDCLAAVVTVVPSKPITTFGL